ncbi:MAG: hypothetical protein ACLP5H_03145 [Desulfomonilaceae bacterium]
MDFDVPENLRPIERSVKQDLEPISRQVEDGDPNLDGLIREISHKGGTHR